MEKEELVPYTQGHMQNQEQCSVVSTNSLLASNLSAVGRKNCTTDLKDQSCTWENPLREVQGAEMKRKMSQHTTALNQGWGTCVPPDVVLQLPCATLTTGHAGNG